MAEEYTIERARLDAQQAELVALANAREASYSALLLSKADAIRDGAAGAAASTAIQAKLNGGTSPAPSPSPSPSPTPVGSPSGADPFMPNAVFNADGSFNTDRYVAVASSMGTMEGVDYVYGPGPAKYGTTGDDDKPLLFQPTNHSGDEFSAALNPNDRFARGCRLGFCGSWQLGGPVHPNEAGMYSSNMGQKLYIPDVRNQDVEGQVGVLTDITFDCGANTATVKPELPWHYGGRGMTAINVMKYGKNGKDVSYPCAIGRAEGRPGWNNNSLTATRGGLIMGDGQNTSSNELTCQLPGGLVPTGLHQSNAGEFAFVTCWDTVNKKGVLAFLALAGTPQGGYLGTDPNTWESYRGELRGCFPGVPNYGNLSFAKYLGVVDLGIKCPTAVASSTYHFWGAYQQFQDNDIDNNGRGWDLRKEQHRAQFRKTGPRWGAWPKRLLVVVASKEEQKTVYVDCSAMLKYFRDTYTSSNGVGAVGLGAGQFPLTFSENPSQKPVVIRTDTHDDRPTSLRLSRWDLQPRVYIGFQRGRVDIINPGAYPNEDGGVWDGNQITKVGSVPCGRNPTWIATVIRHAGSEGREGAGEANYFGNRVYPGADFSREIIVACRGDRKVQWLRMNSGYTSGSVVRTLMDKRLKDPIWVEDNENHTTEHYEVTIADFAGRQIYNARYGKLIFWNNEGVMGDGGPGTENEYHWDVGLPPNGFTIQSSFVGSTEFPFECGGVLPVPGYPYSGATANVY